jgi:hypothetical protein
MGESRFEGVRVRRWALGGTVALLLAGTVVGLVTTNRPSSTAGRDLVDASLRQASGNADTGAGEASGGPSGDALAPTTTMATGAAMSSTGAGAGGSSRVATGVALSAQGAPPMPGRKQKIVKTADLTIEVRKDGFHEAFDKAASVAAGHGGFVVSSTSVADKDQPASGRVVLRVPAAAFDAVRSELGGLGKVKQEQLSGQDVTGEVVDLDARIRSLQAQEDALRTLMAKATTIGDTINVQQQLTQVRQQIEQLSGQRANLEDAADLSTISLSLAEVGAAAPEPNPHPQARLARSWSLAVQGAGMVAGGTLIVVGWLLPLAVLALIGWGAWSLRRRRRVSLASAG